MDFLNFRLTRKLKQVLNRFSLILLVITSLFYAGCKKKAVIDRPIVIIDIPGKDDVELFGEYVGRIRAFRHVEVRARVEGYLERMLFEEGKKVNQDDPLFIIDPALYKAKVDKAKAQLKKDEAAAAKARRDVKRLKPLYEQNAASQLDLDNAQAALESADANVAMSKADLAQAQLDLSYTRVKAPISGYIGERYVDVGTLVGTSNSSLLSTVVQSDTVLVDFKMTALDYLRSQKRDVRFGETDSTRSWQPTVSVTLADNSVYPVKGDVDFADPKVDPKTGTFGVRAELSNPDQRLLPGQFTQVKLLLDVLENAIVVPRKSIIIEKGGAFIYVMRRDSVAEKRFVQTGPELENAMVIERGLGPNESIVIEGQHKLMPGMKVLPVQKGDESKLVQLKEEGRL
ncbi:efflux RND transporter periplasmic adaptor subunit [Marinilabiliaceae bacterium JC017]|nr:efflux RND transporter periplasmic adaptor subunit [Marinilabiliaceae bacterium JC017]